MRNSMIVAALCFFSIILLSNALTDSLSNAFNYTYAFKIIFMGCIYNIHVGKGLVAVVYLRMKFKSEITTKLA
ncbi:hypothetical protein [Psychrosphaera haliotis]|uniref:Uncharacterized protein n=1 Tax=Psychrosphaera haliotis TaxID=555083 RepID=A0A6N8FBG7_9GAMM|nr:hypothetical protein [Psychrosphaera haliotis]MUH73464.1 hypothetical protein [Psychrosphaera haliotis]